MLTALALAGAAGLRADETRDPGGNAPTDATTNPVTVDLLTPDPTALVGTSTASFTLVRAGPTNNAIPIGLTFSGSASNGLDFALVPATVTIPAGVLAIDIPIQPIVKADRPGNKTVVLTLTNSAAFGVAGRAAGKITLIDDIYNDLPPTVAITAPTNNTVVGTPTLLAIQVAASDPDSAVQQVSFYANDHLIGHATSSPWSWTWTNPPAGSWALFARAVDTAGKSTLSQPVQITVTNTVAPVKPTITVTAPKNGANFTAPANIEIDATASSPIQTMEFWFNGRKVGQSTTAPYKYTVTNVRQGFYSLRTVGVTSTGQRVSSGAVSVSVSR